MLIQQFHSRSQPAPMPTDDELAWARAIVADFADQSPIRLATACRILLKSDDPGERADVRGFLDLLQRERRRA